MTEPRLNPLLEPDQTAEFLGVSKATLEKWRNQSRGPVYVRVGRLVRYHQSDLEQWLDGGRNVKRRV
jgi:excisionase family DNA binding protein